MAAVTALLSFSEALDRLDERVGQRVEAVLVNARGMRREWRGELRRRRSMGLAAARVSVPLPVGERWLTVGGRPLPIVIRREDFVEGERHGDELVLRLGAATLALR